MAFTVKSAVRGGVVLVLLACLTEYAEAERNASFDRKQWTW
jgi:vacuolar-type H+-ATPase subunit B/Vma2